MIGLNQIRIGFKNLLKNGFGKNRKRKRKGIISAWAVFFYHSPTPGLLRRPIFPLSFPRGRIRSTGPSPGAAC
jgi:hypothetical protein